MTDKTRRYATSTAFRRALEETFGRRRTHPMPQELPPPPAAWEKPFADMAAQCRLGESVQHAFEQVAEVFRALRR